MKNEIMPSAKDLKKIEKLVLKVRKENKLRIFPACTFGYYSPHEEEYRTQEEEIGLPFWNGCYAGVLLMGIESNGNIKGCLSLQDKRFVEGNVKKQSLKQIWNNTNNFKYIRKFNKKNLSGYCKKCEFGEICRGGCPCMAFFSTGEMHNDPYCLHRISQEKKEIKLSKLKDDYVECANARWF